MKARIKPEWFTYWQETYARLDAPMPPLPTSLDVGALVTADKRTIVEESDKRFITIVGEDGRTATIDMNHLEIVE